MIDATYKYSDITGKIIGLAMEVHREMGNGFQEKIYQRALKYEFTQNSIPFEMECEMSIIYKGQLLGQRRVDFLVNGQIAVELKAVMELENVHLVQTLNYLELCNLEVGLLLNFGSQSLQVKRLLNKKKRKRLR